MSSSTNLNWPEANQRYLRAALDVAGMTLDHYIARIEGKSWDQAHTQAARDTLEQAAMALPAPSALEMLGEVAGLSSFERDVLLLCAGMELDSTFAARCAAAQPDSHRRFPTFSLALAVFPHAHWSCLSPGGPLRYLRLIEVGSGDSLVLSPLRIDERILQYLTGVQHLDQRLEGFVRAVRSNGDLVPTYRTLANQVAGTWSDTGGPAALPVVQLRGNDIVSLLAIAHNACAQMRLRLYQMSAAHIPHDPRELESLARLWGREAILSTTALFLECDKVDIIDPARASAISHFIDATTTVLIIGGDMPRPRVQRPLITLDVSPPTADEQRSLWVSSLGKAAASLDRDVDNLVSQYNLTPSSIHAVANEALRRWSSCRGGNPNPGGNLGVLLSEACRVQTRSRLDGLAQRIEPLARWDDLVLPEMQIKTLREIAIHVRQRRKVYEDWGFARKQSRGLGISSLFAGPSGTGKTMAAEVLANELSLDLFRIDLSQVVSKYIGETEKNLRRVFDAAEESGAVLLFDEADALFGKRSEVKDSHDRYANIEISYLLQRMEAYHGLAILTTNMRSALDEAFLRRIRFIVTFPFPDAAQRGEIWRRIFPRVTPTEGLDINKLARLNVTGGNIANIAMNAAFLAAESAEPVRMTHLLEAARSEFTKLQKPLPQAEIKGWV